MIYFLIGLFIIAAFIAGMFVYRLGINDGMRRIGGAVDLPPLVPKKDDNSYTDNEQQRLISAIEDYDGGTITKKR